MWQSPVCTDRPVSVAGLTETDDALRKVGKVQKSRAGNGWHWREVKDRIGDSGRGGEERKREVKDREGTDPQILERGWIRLWTAGLLRCTYVRRHILISSCCRSAQCSLGYAHREVMDFFVAFVNRTSELNRIVREQAPSFISRMAHRAHPVISLGEPRFSVSPFHSPSCPRLPFHSLIKFSSFPYFLPSSSFPLFCSFWWPFPSASAVRVFWSTVL